MVKWAGVVLAGGQGKRMKSRLPKPLHPVCGKEMILYPVELLEELDLNRILVVASPDNLDAVRELLGPSVQYVVQPRPSGTGDALRLALEALGGEGEHLVVQGADAPLVQAESVRGLMRVHLEEKSRMTVLSARTGTPGDMGRIQRDCNGGLAAIVEAPDAAAITGGHYGGESHEVNGGVYCFEAAWVRDALASIEAAPNGEKYLTAVAAVASKKGDMALPLQTADMEELLAVNDRVQLATVEAAMRRRICEKWMLAGVTITDPSSVYIDARVTIGQDSVILPNSMLSGRTSIGGDCRIGPNVQIDGSTIGDRCRVTASTLEDATLEDDVDVGPYSHLRPGAYLESHVHLGNFAEVKESRLGRGVLMGHFGYVGDASIGAGSNLGAGTITCNFDGKDKHRTEVGENAFVGCDTMLVAPVSVGEGAATGAGAVVTRDVPAGRLAVGVPAKLVDVRRQSY